MLLTFAIAWAAAAVIFLGLDFLWLGQVTPGFYRRELGPLLLDQPRLGIAAGFYLVYVVGIVVFAVMPALASGGIWRALLLGGLLGLIAYGTYDLTNLATLKGWSATVVAVDMVWGTVLTAMAAGGSYMVIAALGR